MKGKNILKKPKEGLSEILKKGLESEINGTEFKVLDRQEKGSGLELDVQIVEKSERGIGILKLYGPNKKSKEYTVMINKHKDRSIKFVTVLAEKIVKPLINQFIKGENMTIEKKKSLREENELKCETCGKVFISSKGLKGHKTRMHKEDKEFAKNLQTKRQWMKVKRF